ncbi:MAG: tetratricopeptide repeat protein [Coraliomargaritaceae bacterium]|tara:strand:- start:1626 stop:1979 length:354 start_codon:yes stop_codon:yes gene_type:complete
MDSKKAIQNEIDDAIFNFTLGENARAKEQLTQLLSEHPNEKEVFHALAEILWSEKDFQSALEVAEKAYALDDKDLHINTTLSRIWVQIGDQEKAEYYNAQARMLGWKEQLKDPPESL